MPVGVVFNDVTDCKEGGVLFEQGFIFTKYSWKSAIVMASQYIFAAKSCGPSP